MDFEQYTAPAAFWHRRGIQSDDWEGSHRTQPDSRFQDPGCSSFDGKTSESVYRLGSDGHLCDRHGSRHHKQYGPAVLAWWHSAGSQLRLPTDWDVRSRSQKHKKQLGFGVEKSGGLLV